jgi:preprotein translocase subunit SecE
MTDMRTRTLAARVIPPIALLAVAGACVLFGVSTTPTDDPTGIAAGQAASLAAPAWVTAVLAVVAAAVLVVGGTDTLAHRGGGLLGLIASIGAALGGLLNLVGYANSDIWWAADPAAIRRAAAVLLVTAIVAIVVIGSEQLRPGWQPKASAG